MEKREISVRVSGLIVFIVKLITVATGIIFTLMIPNLLGETQYGVWGTFNIIVPYFTLLSGSVAFWVLRFVARDQRGATKTGILANLGIGTIAALVFLALLPVVSPTYKLQDYVTVYVVFSAQIIEVYLITAVEASLQAQRPEHVGYGLLIGEVLKVLFGYVFIAILQLGLLGVILGIVVAFIFKLGFYFKIVITELRQKIMFGYVKEWLKGSAFNVYNVIGDRLASIVFLLLASPGIGGGDTGAGYYYAALQIANIITYSTFLAFALTPKLLEEGELDEATVSLKTVLMFAIPMTAGVLALPSSYLNFFKINPTGVGSYVAATPVLVILAIDSLILTISSIFSYVLFGVETVDEKARVPFRQVAKSRIFVAFSLPYVHSAVTIPTTLYALTYLANHDPLQVAISVTGINTVMHLAMFVVLYIVLFRGGVIMNVPWRNIGKYVAAAVPMGLLLFFVHPGGTMTRLPTLIFTAIGGLVYIAILLTIDRETRKLAQSILGSLRNRLQRSRKG